MTQPHLTEPLLVGSGQSISRWQPADGAASAPSAASLAAEAAKRALAGIDASRLGRLHLAAVRTMEDSGPFPAPHGRHDNLPGRIASLAGVAPKGLTYAVAGGQSPQSLVSEMAARIHRGEIDSALVASGEAIGASKVARKAGITLDWGSGEAADAPLDNRGQGEAMLDRYEIKHGLVAPAYLYGLFETAIAAEEGRTLSQHRQAMGELFAPFTEVAAENPYAMYPEQRTADWLATPSRENYEFATPFLKWFIAQDAVNIGAAVLLVSDALADALGIAGDRRIHMLGAGEAADTLMADRARLTGSEAMDIAARRALDQAGLDPASIDLFDLYSCFPCAVRSGLQALGLDANAVAGPKGQALTVTGGLPYAGGPGNAYSLHAIAELTERLRGGAGGTGLVLANGGWMTKEAVGIYGRAPRSGYAPADSPARVTRKAERAPAPSSGELESYTVVHGRKGPERVIAMARDGSGRRFLAVGDEAALARLSGDAILVGAPVRVAADGETNTFSLA